MPNLSLLLQPAPLKLFQGYATLHYVTCSHIYKIWTNLEPKIKSREHTIFDNYIRICRTAQYENLFMLIIYRYSRDHYHVVVKLHSRSITMSLLFHILRIIHVVYTTYRNVVHHMGDPSTSSWLLPLLFTLYIHIVYLIAVHANKRSWSKTA